MQLHWYCCRHETKKIWYQMSWRESCERVTKLMLWAIGLSQLLWQNLKWQFVIFADRLEKRELSPKSATRSCVMTYMTLILWKFLVRGSWQNWDGSIIGTVILWLHDFAIDSHKNVKQWLLSFGDKCPNNNYGEKECKRWANLHHNTAYFFLAIEKNFDNTSNFF